MSRLGTKTYSRKTECKTSVQFENLLTEKGNKPSTAKVSVAGVHRWGMTTFTSLRKSRINGQKTTTSGESVSVEPVKRIKLELDAPLSCSDDPFSFETDSEAVHEKNMSSLAALNPSGLNVETKPVVPKPNKFFKSGSRGSKSSITKNSDFDAVRLSVPPAFNSLQKPQSLPKDSNDFQRPRSVKEPKNSHNFQKPKPLKEPKNSNNLLLNVNTNVINDFTHSSDVYLTSVNPQITDMYASPSPREIKTSNASNNPHMHYISSLIQPVASNDASSRAFDALLTLDLPNKNSETDVLTQLGTATESLNYIDDKMLKYSNYDSVTQSVLNSQHIDSFPSHDNLFFEKSSDSFNGQKNELGIPSQYLSEKTICDTNVLDDFVLNDTVSKPDASSQEFTMSSLEIVSSQDSLSTKENNSTQETVLSQDFASSQESISSSQEKTDPNAVAKQSSRRKIFSSSLKFKAKYNHRHWHSSKKGDESSNDPEASSLADEFDQEMIKESFVDDLIPSVSNTSSGDIRSFKCPKESKEYYTVVKNVKQAYQCHESGETQEFNDDIEYLLECVQECNAIGTRCLSVLNLAAKCMGPAFRIHLRAHGTMPKIFSALKDAPDDPNLALCTATLMFVLSQDRLTMDIEASTLSLMLQLLETDPELRNPDKEIDLILKDPALCAMQDKHREKVYQLCEEMQQKGHAKHLKLDNINTGILAMETLLSLTSRKAGEWFKEEMRTLRGLDRIADTVTSSAHMLTPDENEIISHPTDVQLDKIRKIDRCLRVIENITHMNPENQEYLMHYKNSSLIYAAVNLMKLLKSHLLEQKPVELDISVNEEAAPKSNKEESPILSCLLNLLKILSNITYKIGLDDSQFPPEEGLMDHILMLILQVPRAVPCEKRFDLLVLSLGLMINLVEYCPDNSAKFIEMYGLGSFDTVNDGYEMPASEAFVELMLSRLDAAKLSEEQADELLNSQEEKQAASIEKKDIETAVDDLEETLMKTLQKAGKHMEHSIIAAYIVILLGCVALKNPDFIDILKDYVPDGNLDVMVEVLKKFKSFVTLTGSVGNRELVSIQSVIQILESS
ncbi:wings apart-like protein homolog isoform X1 [Parasteatoda tepidariorum]|uniref:wings apart-like protein homolog isoform X1 n=1 Tax=Parasteatoda tepidariorum TaxID=114398 RepID=UPI001C729404|nr:wings apart-like protein homolog isoform X1 [Parasteatoda tepidariorum]